MGKQLGTWYAEPTAAIISAPGEEHGTKRAGGAIREHPLLIQRLIQSRKPSFQYLIAAFSSVYEESPGKT